MENKKIVITGLGVITPVGIGIDTFWTSLKEGKSGTRPITQFDASQCDSRICGNIPDYNPDDHFSTKDVRKIARFVQYAIVAAKQAVAHANLDLETIEKERFGVMIGSGIGSIATIEREYQKAIDRGPGRISPFFLPRILVNEAAGQVAISVGAKASASCVVTACASATNSIGDALKIMQNGDADIMLAGGTESATSLMGIGGFCALKALSKRNDDPEKASRPFDLNRDGFVMAEGAGVVLLETFEHAKARGAKILAELAGYGQTCDAYHVTAPEPSGMGATRAMEMAIKSAGLSLGEVSYINAHGTSTKLNDKTETQAIKNLFGEDLAKEIPISSTKSMTGHLLGAAGGIECAACVMAVQEDIIPPTINYETPDPECDLDYVPNTARKEEVTVALSNSLGFGGHNATILVKKHTE